jgi:hypothetical protein
MNLSQQMLPLLLFVLQTHTVEAYDCNITFFGTSLDVETSSMCSFVNYHAFMLVAFGTGAVIMFSATVCSILCHNGLMTEGAYVCAKTSVLCLFLAFGLESWFLFVYLAMALLFLCLPVTNFCRSISLARSNSVVDVVVVVEDQPCDTVCPICLEADGSRRWSTTACGHQFHSQCLGSWKERSCPMCRADRF